MTYTKEQKEEIRKQQKAYNNAKEKGNTKAMDAAHTAADEARGFHTITTLEDGKLKQRSTKKLWSGGNNNNLTTGGFNAASKQAAANSNHPAPVLNRAKVFSDILNSTPDKGTSVNPTEKAAVTFAPENTSKIGNFYDNRKSLLPENSLAIKAPLNLNNIQSDKMDNTVKNTILAKSAKESDNQFATTSFERLSSIHEPKTSIMEKNTVADKMVQDAQYQANGQKDTHDNFFAKNIFAGAASFQSSVFRALDLLIPNEIISHGGYDFLEPLFNYTEKVGDKAQKGAQSVNDTKTKEIAGQLVQGTVQAIPNAILAFGTGGTSLVGNTIGQTVASGTGKIAQIERTLSAVVKDLGENPMFWTSFLQTYGPTYDQEIQNGANELQASSSALINGILGSAIEIGGGIETFNPAQGWLKTLARTAGEEGLEEVEQYSLQNLINKAVGSNTAEWGSLDPNKAAVVNPGAQAIQGAYGAAIGGIMGGSQQGASSIINVLNGNAAQQKGASKLFKAFDLNEDYTGDNFAEMNTRLFSQFAETANAVQAMEETGLDDESRTNLANTNDILKTAIKNSAVVPAAKPLYEALSGKIDSMLSAEQTKPIEAQPVIVEEPVSEKTPISAMEVAPQEQTLAEDENVAESQEEDAASAPDVVAVSVPTFKETMYRGKGKTAEQIYNGVKYPVLGEGAYYAFNPEDASNYGDEIETRDVEMQNPIIIKDDSDWTALTQAAGWRYPNPYGLSEEESVNGIKRLKDYVQRLGHDGVVVKYVDDIDGDTNGKTGNWIKILDDVFGHDQAVSYAEEPQEKISTNTLTNGHGREFTLISNDADSITVEDDKGNELKFYRKEEWDADGKKAFAVKGASKGYEILVDPSIVSETPARNTPDNAGSAPQSDATPIQEESPAEAIKNAEKPDQAEAPKATETPVEGESVPKSEPHQAPFDEEALLEKFKGMDITPLEWSDARAVPVRKLLSKDGAKILQANFNGQHAIGTPYFVIKDNFAGEQLKEKLSPFSNTEVPELNNYDLTPKEGYKPIAIAKSGKSSYALFVSENAEEVALLDADYYNYFAKSGFDLFPTGKTSPFLLMRKGAVAGVVLPIRANKAAYTADELRAYVDYKIKQGKPEEEAIALTDIPMTGFKNTTFNIKTRTGVEEVKGLVYGTLGIENGSNVITDIRTGTRITRFDHLNAAKKAIKYMSQTFGNMDISNIKKHKDTDSLNWQTFQYILSGYYDGSSDANDATKAELARYLKSLSDFQNKIGVKPESNASESNMKPVATENKPEHNGGEKKPEGVENNADEVKIQGINERVPSGTKPEVLPGTGINGETGSISEQNGSVGHSNTQQNLSGRNGEEEDIAGSGSSGVRSEDAGDVPNRDASAGSSQSDARRASEGYRITDNSIGKGGKVQRYDQNIAAIVLLKNLESEGRAATTDEMETLAKFSGWGGIKEAFTDNRDAAWQQRSQDIKSLLTKAQYRAAAASTENAFYTPINIIHSIYGILKTLGVRNKSSILEPSCGSGYFIGSMPSELRASSKITGVELDEITGKIAKYLYPNADVKVQGFEKTDIPKRSLDIVVGNIPFGDMRAPYDKEYKEYSKYLIHDYFLLKGLDSLKDGGIMAVITTSGTLDKQDNEVRKLMADKANLVAAIRMPSGTFNATGVVADLLILQKKGDGVEDFGNDFLNVIEWDGITANEYFDNNPEMVLGDFAKTTNQFGQEVTTVKSTGKSIDDIVHLIPKNIIPKAVANVSTQAAVEVFDSEVAHANAINENETFVFDGDKIYKRNEETKELELWHKVYGKGTQKEGQIEYFKPDGKPAKRLRGMLDVYAELHNVLDVQLKTESDAELKKAQAKLSKVYDEFVKENGAISERSNSSVFYDDPRYFQLTALEEKDYSGSTVKYAKSNTFTDRVVPKVKPITSVDNIDDALVLSLNMAGGVDFAYMEELYGKNKDTMLKELGDKVYEIPDEYGGEYVTADEYLSGNVRKKLITAQTMAKEDSRFERNVSALTKIQPEDLRADQISVPLGSPWIGEFYMASFIDELYGHGATVTASYSPYRSAWTFDVKGTTAAERNAADKKWGTNGYDPVKLVDAIVNKKNIQVTVSDGQGHSYVDVEATGMAKAKAEEVKQFFSNWIFKDIDRREKLVDYYNTNFNNLVMRVFDGSYLKMYGVNPRIKLRSFQASAVARTLRSTENVLLAHPVGAGKTYEMIGSAQEMKRLGIAQKPIMVVPNHKVGDFMNDYYEMYPTANILTIKDADFSPKNRKKLLAKIENTNFDCIIMRRSSFNMFDFSPDYKQDYIQKQIDELEEAIRDGAGTMSKKDLSNLNKALAALEKKLDELTDIHREDSDVFFDTCGIDALIVDEAHNFKNLSFVTKMGRVAGVQNSGSKQSTNMHMATELMNDRGKKIVFATATPVSNSIGELYTMMRYLEPDTLKGYNVGSFDAWADTFGEVVSAPEMSTTGNRVTSKERFSKFKNVPELIKIFKLVADIVDKKDLHLNLPEAEYKHVTVESNDILKQYNEFLEKKKQNMSYQEAKKAGHLVLMQDARMAALDLRCVKDLLVQEGIIRHHTDDDALDFPGSKINTAVENIFKEYQDSTDTKGTQVVFLDRGTPPKTTKKELGKLARLKEKDPDELTEEEEEYLAQSQAEKRYNFNLYDDIKYKLIGLGVKPEEIEFFQDSNNGSNPDDKKSKLFDRVNAGQVRILIGSTAVMGEGMNVQRLAVAEHQIDAPQRPSDVEQRTGRVLRQGNLNKSVRLYHYSTKNSYDAPTWEMLARKAKSFNQVMLGDESIREVEDLGGDMFENMSIEAANNPLMFERKDVDDKLKKMEYSKKNFTRSRDMNQNVIRKYFTSVEYNKGMIAALTTVLGKVNKAPVNSFIVKGKECENLKEASIELKVQVQKLKTGEESVPAGSIRGLTVFVSKKSPIEYNVYMEDPEGRLFSKTRAIITDDDTVELADELKTDTVFLKLNNKINRISERIEDHEEILSNLDQEYKTAQKELGDGEFPQENEIVRLRQRLVEIDQSLKKGTSTDVSTDQEDVAENTNDENQYSKGNKPTPTTQKFAGQIYTEEGTSDGKTESVLANIPMNYKAKTIEQIKISMVRNFVVNIHSKNFRRPADVYAYFKPKHSVIVSRFNSAIGPVAHELGHKLDREYGFSRNAAIKRMLMDAPGYNKDLTERGYKDEEKPSEVTADFIMLYLTNPNAAYELGSYAEGENFYDTFESLLSKRDLKNIHDLQRDILMWGAQDSITKGKKTITYRANGEFATFEQRTDAFMRSVVDDIDGAKQFIAAVNAESENDVAARNDTYEMLRKTSAVSSITSSILTEKLINPEGFVVGESLGDVLKGVKQKYMTLFDLYLKDVHALDWMAQGKRVYSIEMDSEDEIRGRIAKMENEHPEFKETADKYYAWWKNFTQMWLVDTGIKSQEFVDELHETYPHYVPNFRKMDGIKGKGGKVGGDPIKRASEKGSDRMTYSAIENMILQVGNIVKAGVQNQAMTTLHTLYNNQEFSETVGLFLDAIPPDIQANKFDATGVKAALRDEFFMDAYSKMNDQEKLEFDGLSEKEQIKRASELSNSQVIDDVIADSITYFTAKKSSNDPNVAVCLINGKPKFYNITDDNLAMAFMALEPRQIGGLLRMTKALTRGFIGWTTANNPLFAIANHARDIQHGYAMTESKYSALNPLSYLSYVKDMLVAFGQIATHTRVSKKLRIKESENYQLYRANAGLASKYMPVGDTFNTTLREINGVRSRHKKTAIGNAAVTTVNVLASAMDLISNFNGAIEAAPRMVAFNRAYKKGGKTPDSLIKAVHAAKEATVDFQRRGTVIANLSAAIPFVGASIAGIDQFRRITMTKEAWTTKEGQQRLLRAVLSQAIPAILMALIYNGDDDYEVLDNYVKDGYWLFKTDKEYFIRIPKEREISAIFGTSFQRITTNYLQPDLDNKEELASYLDYTIKTFTPAHDVTGWAIIEAINNKTWYGGTVVSQRDEALMQPGYYDEIYDDTTSRLAVGLAAILPDVKSLGALNTPKGIEYVIDQLTGGIGDILLPATTPTTSGLPSELLRRYMTDSVYSNKYSGEAYDILDELNAAVMYGDRTNTTDKTVEAWQKAFGNTLSGQSDKYITVSNYYAQIRDNNNNEDLTMDERETANRDARKNINRICEDLVTAYQAGDEPGYSFADVAVDPGAKAAGITDDQYSEAVNVTTGQDAVAQKYALANMTGLSDAQKSYLSETILKNSSYDDWGKAYQSLASKMTVEEVQTGSEAVKAVEDAGGDTYSHVLQSGEHEGETRTDSISAGSKQDTGAEGHKSLSRKKKEAIDAAYPNEDKATKVLLYQLFDVSEKLY